MTIKNQIGEQLPEQSNSGLTPLTSGVSRVLKAAWPAYARRMQAWITRDGHILVYDGGRARGIRPEDARLLAAELVQCADEVESQPEEDSSVSPNNKGKKLCPGSGKKMVYRKGSVHACCPVCGRDLSGWGKDRRTTARRHYR